MNLTIYQVDAFTKRVFAGNPAAVCPLQERLADDVMQQIALENNLSETAFFVKENGVYAIRWFTPTIEIDLCGHATLASAFVIFNHLSETESVINLHSHRSGNLSVEKQGDVLILDFPSHPPVECDLPEAIAEIIGATPVKSWEAQGNMLMLLFESEDEIKSLQPNMSALSELAYDEVIVTAKGTDSDFVSRLFAPRIGIPEDPVTGTTHCSLIPYWAEKIGKEKLYARQISARGGELFCELNGDRVKIGGNAILYLKGEIYV